MLVPHMRNQIIISLDPLFANVLAPGNWAVNSLIKVYQLIVPVERLSRFERGRPGAIGCITSVSVRGASVWAASPVSQCEW